MVLSAIRENKIILNVFQKPPECMFCQIARGTIPLLINYIKGNVRDKDMHAIQLYLHHVRSPLFV